jgi:lauroyl/myristoyl acyltransferase
LLTAHLSFFELGGLVMTDLGFTAVALTVKEPDDSLTRWREKYRKRWGVGTLEVGEDPFALAALRSELDQGKFVVALFDRPVGANPSRVKMPHGSLPCASGILYLAMLTECPIVVVAVTEKENGRYRVEAFEPMNFEKGRVNAARVSAAAQQAMDYLSPVIVRNASSWFQFAPLETQ